MGIPLVSKRLTILTGLVQLQCSYKKMINVNDLRNTPKRNNVIRLQLTFDVNKDVCIYADKQLDLHVFYW